MSETNKILVGKIVATQGLRGEFRVHTFTDAPSDLENLKIPGFENLKVLRTKGLDVAICSMDGINDINAAQALRGTELFIERESLPELPDGQFYQTDLIGMDVIKNGEKLGIVSAIQNFGAGDILELDNGEMISFANAKVDLKNREVII